MNEKKEIRTWSLMSEKEIEKLFAEEEIISSKEEFFALVDQMSLNSRGLITMNTVEAFFSLKGTRSGI